MRRFVWTAATLAVVALMPGCNRKMKISHLPYPDTRRDTTVVDDYHGTCVADPYRWLEDDNSAETAAWVEAENAVTRDYLDRLPARQAIYDRLTALYDYPKEGAPSGTATITTISSTTAFKTSRRCGASARSRLRANCSSIRIPFRPTVRRRSSTSRSPTTAVGARMPPPKPVRIGCGYMSWIPRRVS